jgi:hypothetical protein
MLVLGRLVTFSGDCHLTEYHFTQKPTLTPGHTGLLR